MPLPRCFFDVAINGVATGRVVFELFSDVVPKTAENFRCLCTGERGEGKNTFKPLHYKGTPIHRIVKGFIVQGGDFSNGDGTGGESIYGGMFKDEGFHYKHEKPFLLSMANKGPHTNGSQFFITTRPAPHLDGIHVVFGHVIQGQQFVTEMENQKVDSNHRPYADVRIVNSGELVRVAKSKKAKKKTVVESSTESSEDASSDESPSNTESESETSSDERRKRQRRKQKRKEVLKKEKRKKRRKEKSKSKGKKKSKLSKPPRSDTESDESSSGSESDRVTSTVADDQDVPLPPEIEAGVTNSFLYRKSRTPSPIRKERKNEESVQQNKDKTLFKPRKKHEVSESGRKLKGRGLMRYKTPPRQFGSSPSPHTREPPRQRDDRFETHSRDRAAFRRSRSRSRSRERQRWRNREERRRSRSRERRSPIRQDYNRSRNYSPRRQRHSPDSRHRDNSPGRARHRERREDIQRSRSRERESRRRERSPPRRERRRSHSSERQEVVSKWARHHDSAESESDEEDDKIERAYHGEEEDVFGLAKLSQEMMS